MTLAVTMVVVTPLLMHLCSRQLVWIRPGKISKRLTDALVRICRLVMKTVAHSDDANINQVNMPGFMILALLMT